ncbi:hypothetical protein EZS27_043623, partial [termite gut metagenome]
MFINGSRRVEKENEQEEDGTLLKKCIS